MAKKHQWVEVTWHDSFSARGWKTDDDLDEIWHDTHFLIHSVGTIVRQDKRRVALCGCVDGQKPPNKNRYLEIPRSVIQSIRKLK